MTTYRDKQKRAHFESFANKIYTGIREIKPDYAEKRAIWELFQNALDTIDKDGEIEIIKTEKGFIFKHNGRPFSDLEFGGLIKQFSVGKEYGDNKDKIGQYGTGFISTHVYGKTIEVNTSIELEDKKYKILKDFKLDRSASTPELLTDDLLAQDAFLEELIDVNQDSVPSPLPFTSYEYLASESKKIRIENMFDYIVTIIPYIFCFNKKLQSVRINDGRKNELFERKANEIQQLLLLRNNEPFTFPYIQNDEQNVKIILGSKTIDLSNVPKLFLFYPLMETSDVGHNFLIHADDFKPNKERDYLHKEKDNPELESDVETNEKLLKIAFQLISNKIKNGQEIDFWEACKIEFTVQDSIFEKKLKESFIDEIKIVEKIQIGEEYKAIDSFEYLDDTILLMDIETIKSIYSLLSQFKKLPPFELYCEISKHINNWNLHIENKFQLLTLESIGEIINNEGGGNVYYILDKSAYKKFIEELSKNITLLNKFALVPNIHGCFKHIDKLVKWNKVENDLISVIDCVNYKTSEKYLHSEFYFIENVNIYNRENFKDDYSKFCNNLNEEFSKVEPSIPLGYVRKEMLKQHLYNFIALNQKTILNNQIADFYKRIFGLTPQLKQIENPSVDLNYQPSFKLLANLYLQDLDRNRIKDILEDLKQIISIMFENKNLKEELLHKLPCIPNQNFKLKSQSELKKDNIKDDDFKKKHIEITGDDVLDELAYDGFESFLQHNGSVSGNELGDTIEIKLHPERRFIPVKDLVNGVIDKILKIIEKISERPNTWGQWLPNINRVKEEILMHKFQNENTRSSLFSILTKDEDTIGLLGDLAKIENLVDLVEKGKEKQREENRKNNHLNYINFIGLSIQDLVQEQLDKELADVIAVKKSKEDAVLVNQEEQNGQDFIIYKDNKPIYFIEVKSKWDENGRFALSKNQTEKCALEKNRYAVISVNVDRYKRKHQIDEELNIEFEDLNEFINVNDDLGDYFEALVKENLTKSDTNDPKLIEYRGSIPQTQIDTYGKSFDEFVSNLIELMKRA
jgi:hypothetical protein